MSRVGFLTLAILKDAGIRPEVRVDEGGEEWQDVARGGLEKGGRDGVKGGGSGMVRHY